MSIGMILIVLALIFAALEMVLWFAIATYRRILLLPLAVVLIAVALLIGAGGIHA